MRGTSTAHTKLRYIFLPALLIAGCAPALEPITIARDVSGARVEVNAPPAVPKDQQFRWTDALWNKYMLDCRTGLLNTITAPQAAAARVCACTGDLIQTRFTAVQLVTMGTQMNEGKKLDVKDYPALTAIAVVCARA